LVIPRSKNLYLRGLIAIFQFFFNQDFGHLIVRLNDGYELAQAVLLSILF